MNYNYTKKEIETLLKNMVIISDTREQKNQHILEYFDSKHISYKEECLDYGDYSCMLPANPELGIMRDVYFSSDLVIERKGSLDELAGNFANDRTRIESELLRVKGKAILLIEGASYGDIISHNYRSQYLPKSFIATLKAFEARYDMGTVFIDKALAGDFMYHTFKYLVREKLQG